MRPCFRIEFRTVETSTLKLKNSSYRRHGIVDDLPKAGRDCIARTISIPATKVRSLFRTPVDNTRISNTVSDQFMVRERNRKTPDREGCKNRCGPNRKRVSMAGSEQVGWRRVPGHRDWINPNNESKFVIWHVSLIFLDSIDNNHFGKRAHWSLLVTKFQLCFRQPWKSPGLSYTTDPQTYFSWSAPRGREGSKLPKRNYQ